MLTQQQVETDLRRHTTKIRAGFRGLIDLMHKRFDSTVDVDHLDAYETLIMAQLEASISELTKAIQDGSRRSPRSK